jgi:hypothetical protein
MEAHKGRRRQLCFIASFVVLFALPGALVSAWDLGIVQETSGTAQLQTVQAQEYLGLYQGSYGVEWTLGADWNRTVTVRGGLTYRWVQTSPVVYSTVYPGYQGWGWTAALDVVPFRTGWAGATWALGGTAAFGYESLEYPGLYRSFELPSVTLAPLGEVVPDRTSGLAFRVRVPVGLDQRANFWLAWRIGFEASVVFRGVGWSFE